MAQPDELVVVSAAQMQFKESTGGSKAAKKRRKAVDFMLPEAKRNQAKRKAILDARFCLLEPRRDAEPRINLLALRAQSRGDEVRRTWTELPNYSKTRGDLLSFFCRCVWPVSGPA